MRYSAKEIKDQKFKKKMRGFDPEEVEVFVQMVADDFEEFEKENKALKGQAKDFKLEIEALQKSEAESKKKVAAEKTDASAIEEAQKKGREIILTAMRKAKELKETAMAEAMEIEREISKLREAKKQSLEAVDGSE